MPRAKAASPKRTRSERLLHELNNSLSAMRLRLDLIVSDPTCIWAQGTNIGALSKILEEARQSADQLEIEAGKASRPPAGAAAAPPKPGRAAPVRKVVPRAGAR